MMHMFPFNIENTILMSFNQSLNSQNNSQMLVAI